MTNFAFLFQVNHSQRARDTPLKSWIFSKESGEVITAHYDCMAEIGECCSHVGAILFAVEAVCRMRDSTTCTQEKSQWLMPGYVKDIPYAPVQEIDFTSAKKKHVLLLETKCNQRH